MQKAAPLAPLVSAWRMYSKLNILIYKLLKTNSIFIPFLGRRNYDLDFEKKMLENLGLKIEKEIDLDELEFLGKRHLKLLKKVTESAVKSLPVTSIV